MDIIETIYSELKHSVPIRTNLNRSDNMKQWCRDHFGHELFVESKRLAGFNYAPGGRWDYLVGNGIEFYFQNTDDALLFKLTWGGE